MARRDTVVDFGMLVAARGKYRLLEAEIKQVKNARLRENLLHTHSKLGIFLADAITELWREAGQIEHLEKMFRG